MAKRRNPRSHLKNRSWRKGNPWSRIIVLSLVLLSLLVLAGGYVAWSNSKAVQSTAQHSLERLCEVYNCPPSPEPGKTYVESASGRIRFLRQADFETALRTDGMMGSDRTTAFTSRTGPRIIYFNLDDVSDLGEGSLHYYDIITGLLEHEVVHQVAISQPLPRPLTLSFANRTFVATHTAGLSLIDDWNHLDLNFLNEAATEWLAKDLREANFEKLPPIYETGSEVFAWLMSRAGLEKKQAFELYVHQGLPGFTPYFLSLAGPPLVSSLGSRDTAGMAIIVYADRVMAEIGKSEYGFDEAIKRISTFVETGIAPPQR